MSDTFIIGTFGFFPENEIIPDVTEIGTRGWWHGAPSLSAGANIDQTVELLTDCEQTVNTNDDIENVVDLNSDIEHTVEGLE